MKRKAGAKKLISILKETGIDIFIATKVNYNSCVGSNDFYKMLNRRLEYRKPEELAQFFRHELHYHFKEFAQYQ